jgi:hypothetical protein
MPVLKQVLSVILLGTLASCNPLSGGKEASNFGANFNPGLPNSEATPPPSPDSQNAVGSVNGFKVTPGANSMTGPNSSAHATILTNDEKLVGGNVSGRFSINKTQVR